MEKRISRKSQILERGINEFSFDFEKEFAIWLYVTGERMGKRNGKT